MPQMHQLNNIALIIGTKYRFHKFRRIMLSPHLTIQAVVHLCIRGEPLSSSFSFSFSASRALSFILKLEKWKGMWSATVWCLWDFKATKTEDLGRFFSVLWKMTLQIKRCHLVCMLYVLFFYRQVMFSGRTRGVDISPFAKEMCYHSMQLAIQRVLHYMTSFVNDE